MKPTLKKILHANFFLLFAFILSDCSKDPSNNPVNTSGPFGFEFTVDSQKYSWYGNPLNNYRIPSDNQCIYDEDTTTRSGGFMRPKKSKYGVFIGVKIWSKDAWNLGSRVFDNNSGDLDYIQFVNDDLGATGQIGTSRATGASVTLTITEKGGFYGHVKGNLSGTLINLSTQKPMIISGTFDLCNYIQ